MTMTYIINEEDKKILDAAKAEIEFGDHLSREIQKDPDPKVIEAAKNIFEGIDKIKVKEYYTFSTLGKDGLKWYPKSTKGGFQDNLITDWTNNKAEALVWTNPEHFDCLMNEYCDTEIETVEKPIYKKLITITNANNQEKFISFKVDGLEDGITVGLYPNNDGLVINYKGDQIGIPFNADSDLIKELNNGDI